MPTCCLNKTLAVVFTCLKPSCLANVIYSNSIFNFQVKVGDSSYVHLRVFKPLPHAGSTLELAGIKTGMKEGDSLDYF